MAGELYLCSTPIGNLEDITLRALRILREADLIAAEDTRHTRKLLHHYQIDTPLTSYHEHNARQKGAYLLELLREGKVIALVSDAGTPGISDPGTLLVQQAIEAGIPVTPIPGATAAITALSISGLATDKFVFEGFLPRSPRERKERLEKLAREDRTIILYEAPHRLVATLKVISEVLPHRRMAVARELTKHYEEVIRGSTEEILAHFRETTPRGEFTLILEGCREGEREQQQEIEADPEELVRTLEEQGYDWKAAIKEAAKRLGMPKREVYRLVKGPGKNN